MPNSICSRFHPSKSIFCITLKNKFFYKALGNNTFSGLAPIEIFILGVRLGDPIADIFKTLKTSNSLGLPRGSCSGARLALPTSGYVEKSLIIW
jgi:hypothetical protein